MNQRAPLLVVACCAVLLTGTAHAQGGGASSLSGRVDDSSGAAAPGAAVVVRNEGTGAEFTTSTSSAGDFSIPALNPGRYTVNVSLSGFKTAVLRGVVLNAAVPATVRAVLEVGGLAEKVTVEGAGDIVQREATALSTTIEANQIMKIPVTSRNAMDFVPLLPGVSTLSTNRNSIISGLPHSTINITLDGVNIQDNWLKESDGFFAMVSPQLDAVEEVTLTSAGGGANATGQGATQIRFVTRSGTNEFHGSLYDYFRHDSLNANTFFNSRDGVAKPKLTQHQPGIRIGGPIIIPGVFNGRDRAHFFVNYEEFRQPSDLTRTRTLLSPSAQLGLFRYNAAEGVREINLLTLAAANGQVATIDPTIAKLLADIRASTAVTGSITNLTDPLAQRYTFNVRQKILNRYPTARLDFDISNRHHLMMSANFTRLNSNPGPMLDRVPFFPGFPVTASQVSRRYQATLALRSTLRPSLINEFRIGGSGGPTEFGRDLDASMWSGSVASQAGFHLNLAGACCGLSNASSPPTPSARNASTKLIEDTLYWQKGAHRISAGVFLTQVNVWLWNQNLVPQANFGVGATDPASSMFNATNFPGASAANLNSARGLYALLTGRITSITGNARLDEATDQYKYLGASTQRARMRQGDAFLQDAWRVRPNLTINYGLRYSVQQPSLALNNSYSRGTIESLFGVSGVPPHCDLSHPVPADCNLFQPGVRGLPPTFSPLRKGEKLYETDWNNIAPSLGVAFRPTASGGWLRKLLGAEGDSVLRAAFSRSYNWEGLEPFTDLSLLNPGVTITTDRSVTLGNLGALPLLLRETSRLGPPNFPTVRAYPISEPITEDVYIFDPHLKVPYADTWMIGFQRALGRNTRLDVRYVGSRSVDNWFVYAFNEINILENGFLSEFRLAQANLQSNLAAGRGPTFRYFGPGTGTSPLPISLAYFSGLPAGAAADPSNYTSSLFASSSFVDPLARLNPDPFRFANTLYTGGRHLNAVRAGLPPNFFLLNPDLQGGAYVFGNGPGTRSHGPAVELYRRFANKLQFQASYEYTTQHRGFFYSLRRPFKSWVVNGSRTGNGESFKANWVWDLPAGISFSGSAIVRSGIRTDFLNVRLVGFNEAELRKMYRLRTAENGRLYMLPQDVIDNTVKAFSVSATSATGYGPLGPPSGRYLAPANGPDCIETTPLDGGIGDCGVGSLEIDGPKQVRFNLGISKQFRLPGKFRLEARVEMLNAFNTPYFYAVRSGVSVPGFLADASNPDAFEVTNGDSGRIVQLVGRITF
jgi:hypothetical protein